jgi:hypothetical protein
MLQEPLLGTACEQPLPLQMNLLSAVNVFAHLLMLK